MLLSEYKLQLSIEITMDISYRERFNVVRQAILQTKWSYENGRFFRVNVVASTFFIQIIFLQFETFYS